MAGVGEEEGEGEGDVQGEAVVLVVVVGVPGPMEGSMEEGDRIGLGAAEEGEHG